jgi:hypothetical protein
VNANATQQFGLVAALCACALAAVHGGDVTVEREITEAACLLLSKAGAMADSGADDGENGRRAAPTILAFLTGVKALLESHSEFESLDSLLDAHTVVLHAGDVLTEIGR